MDSEQAWVDFDGESFSVDAALIAEGLGVGPAHVQSLMRARRITSRCERGVEDDAGHYRLTFRHDDRRLRFIVDAGGRIVKRTLDTPSPRDDTR